MAVAVANKMAKKIRKKTEIKKEMTFAEIIKNNPEAGNKLAEKGMFCCGCPMAMMETLEQGAIAHGQNPEDIVKELNKKNKKKK